MSKPSFQDIWENNFYTDWLFQHKIRLVRSSNNRVYVAFSRYYAEKDRNIFKPSKSHYLLPIEYWKNLKIGFKQLNKFLKTFENGELSTSNAPDGRAISGTGASAAIDNQRDLSGGKPISISDAELNSIPISDQSSSAEPIPTRINEPIIVNSPSLSNSVCSTSSATVHPTPNVQFKATYSPSTFIRPRKTPINYSSSCSVKAISNSKSSNNNEEKIHAKPVKKFIILEPAIYTDPIPICSSEDEEK